MCTEGHVARKLSADIHKREVIFVLIICPLFIFAVSQIQSENRRPQACLFFPLSRDPIPQSLAETREAWLAAAFQ